jgi:RNA polymerase sigma-70 factor, ECF subfamily
MNEISQEILIRAQGGDTEAFEAIYKALSGFVYNVALRIVQSANDADEITQDVFVKIYKSLKDFESKSSFKTWAYRITVNTALNHARASVKDKNVVGMDDISILADKRDELKAKIEKEDSETKVNSMLALLNPDQRACIVLRELEGFDYKEIADTLNIPINTVRSRLKRAREMLVSFAKWGVESHEVRQG